VTSISQAFILEIPVQQTVSNSSLGIVSYNIQQGSDDYANKNFEGQYNVIKNLDGDIIGLQESDTCRISSGNSDIVRFINNRLKLYSYYGPKTVTGTFGIALLSKYPILNPKTFYMESKGEQTATIWVQIFVGSTLFNIFVTHLGNYEDPTEDRSQIVQQENILSVIAGKQNVILMGDFNFEPNTEQYNITVAELYDCWEIAPAPQRMIGDVPESWIPRLPNERIDHIFVSEQLNTSVSEILYTGGDAADHPCVYTTLTGPF
jgi:endonuclease/exonuclease/phosphatase family metal-dependent hydrolase